MPIRLLTLVLFLSAMPALAQSPPSASSEKHAVLWQKLERDIRQTTEAVDGVMAVVVTDLTSGEQILIHPDELMPQASSIKIAVLLELYRQSQSGRLSLSDGYVVRAEDLVQDSDIMNGLTPGVTRLTLRDLATMMVAVSDNAATNVLIDRLGMEEVNATLSSLGLRSTRLRRKMMDLEAARAGRENVATAREMASLLRQVYDGKVLRQDLTADFFHVLATHKESDIPRLLPEGLKVADKPGSLEGVRTDSGVIFVPGRPFVLSVMGTYLRDERAAESAISRIARLAYDYFDRVARSSALGRVISTANSSVRP
jgi:beta-lactamase class A